jgi:hypothetical protein
VVLGAWLGNSPLGRWSHSWVLFGAWVAVLVYLFGGITGLDQGFKRIPMIISHKLVKKKKKNHAKGAAHAAPFAQLYLYTGNTNLENNHTHQSGCGVHLGLLFLIVHRLCLGGGLLGLRVLIMVWWGCIKTWE